MNLAKAQSPAAFISCLYEADGLLYWQSEGHMRRTKREAETREAATDGGVGDNLNDPNKDNFSTRRQAHLTRQCMPLSRQEVLWQYEGQTNS